jgi:hypothetical protein
MHASWMIDWYSSCTFHVFCFVVTYIRSYDCINIYCFSSFHGMINRVIKYNNNYNTHIGLKMKRRTIFFCSSEFWCNASMREIPTKRLRRIALLFLFRNMLLLLGKWICFQIHINLIIYFKMRKHMIWCCDGCKYEIIVKLLQSGK